MGGVGKKNTGSWKVNQLIEKGKLSISTCKSVEEGTVAVEVMKSNNMSVADSRLILDYNLKDFKMNIKLNELDYKKMAEEKGDEIFAAIGPLRGKDVGTIANIVVVFTGLDCLRKFVKYAIEKFSKEKVEQEKKSRDELMQTAKATELEAKVNRIVKKVDDIAHYLRGKEEHEKTREEETEKKDEETKVGNGSDDDGGPKCD